MERLHAGIVDTFHLIAVDQHELPIICTRGNMCDE